MTEILHGAATEYTRPSKSRRKRDMLALQDLGEKLLALTPEQLAPMNLPEDLLEALCFYHSLKDKEARRRHLQFIGSLMRKVEVEPIRQVLAGLDQLHFRQAENFHQVEAWRDALVAGDEALLGTLVGRFGLERQQIRHLIRAAALEKAAGKPPRQGRVLFRLLRQRLEAEPGI